MGVKKIKIGWPTGILLALVVIAVIVTTFPAPFGVGAGNYPLGFFGASNESLVENMLYAGMGVLTVVAPLIAFRWPVLSLLCGLSLFISLNFSFNPPLNMTGSGWINFKVSSFISLLAVTFVVARGSLRYGVIAALVTAVMPLSYAVYPKTNLWTMGPSGVVTGNGEPVTHRLTTSGAFLLGILLVLALASLLRRGDKQRIERQELENEAAEVDARAELARDLHDVVAHRISMVAVRAETAPYTHADMDEKSQKVFGEIAHDARGALDEMREVLGVLHRGDGGQRLPQPQTSNIPSLFEDARSVGTQVVVIGEIPRMSAVTGHVAYRVIQEALTNARRHGAGDAVTIDLHEDAGIVIRVSNPTRREDFVIGRGLSGMRERVIQSGGQFKADILDGFFVVEVTLPRGEHE